MESSLFLYVTFAYQIKYVKFTLHFKISYIMETLLESLTPIFAILSPVFILLVIFVYNTRREKNRFNTIIEVSKNIKDVDQIKDLLEGLARKKSSIDLRRSGLVTIFAGVGLTGLDYFGLDTKVIFGVGLFVMFIGIGQMLAGYVYPNQPDEINRAVEDYEKV